MLTDLGTTFVNGPIAALGQWAQEYGDELTTAQAG